jgi:hypothetical protein
LAVLAREVVAKKPIEMNVKHAAKAKIVNTRFVMSIDCFFIELSSL